MASTFTQDNSAPPLSGMRVIEFGLFHAGPTCAAMLGALGAEVIKVEDPKKGDPARGLVRLYGQDCTLPGGRSVPFETYNGGKKSVTLNLTHAEGRRVFYALVAKADVFIYTGLSCLGRVLLQLLVGQRHGLSQKRRGERCQSSIPQVPRRRSVMV